jgi:hypothetical protein
MSAPVQLLVVYGVLLIGALFLLERINRGKDDE